MLQLWLSGQGNPSDLMQVERGHRVAVLGGCNTGKTDLCLSLVGLSYSNNPRTKAALDGRRIAGMSLSELARRSAYIQSNARTLFSGVFDTVVDELRFSLSLLGEAASEKIEAIHRLLDDFNLRHLSDRDPFTLSGGEKCRTAFALQLIKEPELIVLDQVFDQLDPDNRVLIRKMLARRCEMGAVVVEAHASEDTMQGSYQLVLRLPDEGREESPVKGGRWNLRSRTREPNATGLQDATVLDARGLAFSYGPQAFSLGPVDLIIRARECIALVGSNGSGKTTLLRCLGLLLEPSYDNLWVFDLTGARQSPPRSKRSRYLWARLVQYAFQDPTDQLYKSTVEEELEENGLRMGGDPAAVRVRLNTVADSLGLVPVLHENPLSLPRPIQRLVTIGAILIAGPPLILLDEPTGELDVDQKQRLKNAIYEFCDQGGACLMVSHDHEFTTCVCTRTVEIDNGKLSLGSDA